MREYREVRRELEGDDAVAYMGPARAMLGALKTQMQRGGLLQGARTVDLPDGTTIRVQSVFGQDKIAIVAPVPGQQGAPQEQIVVTPPVFEEFKVNPLKDPDALAQSIAACGTFEIDDPYVGGLQLTTFPFYWTPGGGKVLIPLSGLTGGTNAISQDGTTVCGMDRTAVSTFNAYRWRRGEAAVTHVPIIGGIGSGAIGLSADGGEVIMATIISGTTYRFYRWSEALGVVAIATVGSLQAGVPPQTSRDGNYICGNIGPSDQTLQVAHAWDRNGKEYVCPSGPRHLAWDVSNNGIVVTRRFGDDGDVRLWNVRTGAIEQLPLGVFRDQVSISSDGEHVVGGRQGSTGGLAGAAHIDHQRVVRELPPLTVQGAAVQNFARSVDAYGGYAVIGGIAAVPGAVNATSHRFDEGVWEYLPTGYRLTRLPVTPGPLLNGHLEGGVITDVTIARRAFTVDFG